MSWTYTGKIGRFGVIDPSFQNLLDAIKREHELKKDQTISPDDRILISDGLNLYLRAYCATPTLNANGIHIGGISGFLTSLGYAIKNLNPTRVIIVFDGKGGSKKRKKLYPDYKANRSPTRKYNRAVTTVVDDEQKSMIAQLNRLSEYLEYLPVTILSVDNVEADDVIAYIATDVCNDSDINIMSTDKDFLQLVDDRISVWSPTKKRLYGAHKVLEDYGIPVHNFLTYKLLDGDRSDNIPGVKGAGLKTLQKRLPMLLSDNKVTWRQVVEYAKEHTKEAKLLQNISESMYLLLIL